MCFMKRAMSCGVGLEICCGDIGSAVAAMQGGAERIELCSGLAEGGLTPSVGMIRETSRLGLPLVNVLLRPRPGDFLYDRSESLLLEYDTTESIRSGAGGVVIGALTPEGDVDMELCSRLVARVRENTDRHVNITFHRAFDLARDAERSLEDIISLGCNCLLTSGMASSAEEGIVTLRELVCQADGRIMIMAGGGINPDNAARIINDTGVGAIHATARSLIKSGMSFRREGVPMGAPGSDEYVRKTTDPLVVAQLKKITESFNR